MVSWYQWSKGDFPGLRQELAAVPGRGARWEPPAQVLRLQNPAPLAAAQASPPVWATISVGVRPVAGLVRLAELRVSFLCALVAGCGSLPDCPGRWQPRVPVLSPRSWPHGERGM